MELQLVILGSYRSRSLKLGLIFMSSGCYIVMERLTPVTNSQSLLLSCIEHGADNQESRGDGPFAHTQNEANDEQTCKILAGSMGAKGNGPDKYIATGEGESWIAFTDE